MNEYLMELGYELSRDEKVDEIEKNIDKLEKKIFDNFGVANEAQQLELRNLQLERTLRAASVVRKWLADNVTYSLKLDKIDEETDPIEYFLMESKEGYCVHYAAAAVEIMRMAFGIPARYATGYVVDADSFVENEGVYEATVLDSSAHAWPEVFLIGVGWVPYEVTGGYYPEKEILEENPDDGEDENSNDISSDDSEKVSDDSYKNDAVTPLPQETPASVTKKEKVNKDNLYSIIIVSFIVIFSVTAIILAVLFFLYKYRMRREFFDVIRKKKTRQAVKVINRKLYKKLCQNGKVERKNILDKEFEAILKKTYEDIPVGEWERYMEIAVAAAFSRRDITVEEMEFCYEIYKKCC